VPARNSHSVSWTAGRSSSPHRSRQPVRRSPGSVRPFHCSASLDRRTLSLAIPFSARRWRVGIRHVHGARVSGQIDGRRTSSSDAQFGHEVGRVMQGTSRAAGVYQKLSVRKRWPTSLAASAARPVSSPVTDQQGSQGCRQHCDLLFMFPSVRLERADHQPFDPSHPSCFALDDGDTGFVAASHSFEHIIPQGQQ